MAVEWLRDLAPPNRHDEMPPWLAWTYAVVSGCLVLVAGLASGLTLALMSMSEVDMEVGRQLVWRPDAPHGCTGGLRGQCAEQRRGAPPSAQRAVPTAGGAPCLPARRS
jgi:hypothetical protein